MQSIQSSKATVIAASILAADCSRLGEDVQAVDAAGADWMHVDVMDGRYVPNITIASSSLPRHDALLNATQ